MSSSPQTIVLDLSGVVAPIGLLKCNCILADLQPEESLVVLIQDPDVLNDLSAIVSRSDHLTLEKAREKDHYRVSIAKI